MSEPRRHHYVPACYLSAFADRVDRFGRLMVFDRTSGKTWPSTPDKAAHMRDFYRVEVDNHAYIAEESLSKLEGIFAPALAAVNRDSVLPPDSAIRPLLAFVAMQAARTPRTRQWLADGHDQVMMATLRVSVADKARFPAMAKRIIPDATEEEVAETYEAIREFLAAPGARVQMDQTTLIGNALDLAVTLEDVLAARTWVLGVAPSGTSFITTDNPVVLEWAHPGEPPRSWTPGFGRADTVVSVPIGPRYIAAGLPMPQVNRRFDLTAAAVARSNTRLALSAERFVFFGGASFAFAGPNGDFAAGPTEWLGTRD